MKKLLLWSMISDTYYCILNHFYVISFNMTKLWERIKRELRLWPPSRIWLQPN